MYTDDCWFQWFPFSEGNNQQHANNEIEEDDSKVIEDIIGFDPIKFVPGFILGEDDEGSHCQKTFMKCVSGSLFKGGMQHSNDPEGISGQVKFILNITLPSISDLYPCHQFKSFEMCIRLFFSRYLRKVFFRVGFKGGFGNVWKALMDIPEVYKT